MRTHYQNLMNPLSYPHTGNRTINLDEYVISFSVAEDKVFKLGARVMGTVFRSFGIYNDAEGIPANLRRSTAKTEDGRPADSSRGGRMKTEKSKALSTFDNPLKPEHALTRYNILVRKSIIRSPPPLHPFLITPFPNLRY